MCIRDSSKAVQEVFIKLYEKGYIYKGSRIINWCPVCQTSISDAEVEHEDQEDVYKRQIASDPDTDRYSFKLEFDHYIKGQTCYGLDKLILNNNYADATNMKEAVEDSFMLRNYGTEDGNEALQKTESGGV